MLRYNYYKIPSEQYLFKRILKYIYILYILFFTTIVSILVIIALTMSVHANEQVTRATLKNGLRVVIIRNSLAPVVTTVVHRKLIDT